MKTREIKKVIVRLENNIINKYGVVICVLKNTKKYRDMQFLFFCKMKTNMNNIRFIEYGHYFGEIKTSNKEDVMTAFWVLVESEEFI